MNKKTILFFLLLVSMSLLYAGNHSCRRLSIDETMSVFGGKTPSINPPKPKPIPEIKLDDVPYAGQYIWINRNEVMPRSKHYCALACTTMITEWVKTRRGSRTTWVYNSSDKFYCVEDNDREDILLEMDDDLLSGKLERKYGSGYVPAIDVGSGGTVVTSNFSDEDNLNDTKDALLALAYKYSTENVKSGYPEVGSFYIYPKPSLGYSQYISYAETGKSYSNAMDFIADYLMNDEKPLLAIVDNIGCLHYIVIDGVYNPDGKDDEREFYLLDPAENEYDNPDKTKIRKIDNDELCDWLSISDRSSFGWVPDYLRFYASYEPQAMLGYYAIWD